tara:strand:- start:70 stop:858 length:789 start_codon:yes stop_codon:yes gene_type:complete
MFLFYGSYITYSATKVFPKINYGEILNYSKNNYNFPNKCLHYYNVKDGGYMLSRFLDAYSSYVLILDEEEIKPDALRVLKELQCKANEIIKSNNEGLILLSVAMQVDTKYYYKLGNTEAGKEYFNVFYKDWFEKAILITEVMPKRGDFLFPFLSYAINNNKTTDAVKICTKKVAGVASFCELIFAYDLLNKDINKNNIDKSITLVKNAIEKGIFNELMYEFEFKRKGTTGHGLKGIPLSPNLLFLISDEEKVKLERLVEVQK